MPTILNFQESQQLPDDPTATDVNPERFGRDAAALAGFGGEVSRLGNSLIKARKQAEDVDAVANTSAEYRKWHTERSNQLRTENPDGYAEVLRKESEDRLAQDMEVLPSNDARRAYQAKMDGFVAGSYAASYADQAQNKVKTYRTNAQERTNLAANELMQSPDPFRYTTELKAQIEDIDKSTGTIFSPQEAEEMKKASRHAMAEGLFNGYTKDANSAEQGLSLLEAAGQDGLNVTDAFNADEQRIWRDRLEQVAGQGKRESAHDFQVKKSNIVDNLTSGDPDKIDRVTPEEMTALVSQAERLASGKNPSLTQNDLVETKVTMASALAHSQLRKQMVTMPPSSYAENNKLIEETYRENLKRMGADPSTAAAYHNKFAEQNQRFWQDLTRARNKDLNGYIEDAFIGKIAGGHKPSGMPDDERIDSRMAKAEYLEQAPKGYLSENEVQHVRKNLEVLGKENPDAAAEMIFDMSQSKYAKETMRQLADNNGVADYLLAASFMHTQDAMRTVIANAEPKRQAELNSQYKDLETSDASKFDKSVNAKMKPFMDALSAQGATNLETQGALQKAVRLEALSGMQGGRIGDQQKAVDAAYNRIIGKSFHVSGKVYMPTRIGNTPINQKLVEARMQDVYNTDAWKEWGVELPVVAGVKDGYDGSRKGPTQMHGYINDETRMNTAVARVVQGGRWATKLDMSGAVFQLPTRDDPNVFYTPRGSSGQAIEIDFLESTKRPNKRVLDSQKTFLDKINAGPVIKDGIDSAIGAGKAISSGWSEFWGNGTVVPPGQQKITQDAYATGQAPKQGAMEQDRGPQSGEQYQDAPYDPKDSVKYHFKRPLPTEVVLGEASHGTTYNLPSEIDDGVEIGDASISFRAELKPHIKEIEALQKQYGFKNDIFMKLIGHESNFNPNAQSGTGPVGLAQLTRSNAIKAGMKVGAWNSTTGKLLPGEEANDERITDPAKSLKVGAKLLSTLQARYAKYKDPRIVLMAYNGGEPALNSGIKRLQDNGLKVTYDNLVQHGGSSITEQMKEYPKSVFKRKDTKHAIKDVQQKQGG